MQSKYVFQQLYFSIIQLLKITTITDPYPQFGFVGGYPLLLIACSFSKLHIVMLKTFLYVEYSSQEDLSEEEIYKEISAPFYLSKSYASIIADMRHAQLQKQWYVFINFAPYYIRNNV